MSNLPKGPFVVKRDAGAPGRDMKASKLRRSGPSMSTKKVRRIAAGGFAAFLLVVIIAMIIAIVVKKSNCDEKAQNQYKEPELTLAGCSSYKTCLACSKKTCARVAFKFDLYAKVTNLKESGMTFLLLIQGEDKGTNVKFEVKNIDGKLKGKYTCDNGDPVKATVSEKGTDGSIYLQYYPRYNAESGSLLIWPRLVFKGKRDQSMNFWQGNPCTFFVPASVTPNGTATVSEMKGGLTKIKKSDN